MTWLTGWYRRKSKMINGSIVGPQTNYQIRLTVYRQIGTDTSTNIYLGTNIRNDFGDIRFTDSDGTTLLNYWVESYISGSVANIWVNIPYIPIGPNTTTIYIYYDNPSVTSASDGKNTFYFFDDFNIFDNSVWRVGSIGPGWSYNITGGTLNLSGNTGKHTAGSLNIVTENSIPILGREIQFRGITATLNGSTFDEYVMMLTLSSEKVANGNFGNFIYFDSLQPVTNGLNLWIEQSMHSNNTTLNIERKIAGIKTTLYSSVISSPAAITDNIFTIRLIDANNLIILRGGIVILSVTDLSLNFDDAYLYLINADSSNQSNTVKFDDVRIRKYISPEPLFGASGPEELSVANITAMSITPSSTLCIEPCDITVDIIWENTGTISGSFEPAIIVDDTRIAMSSETLGPGLTVIRTFTITDLTRGSHRICPDPN